MSSNVISLSHHQMQKTSSKSALLTCFSQMRRDPSDVYWLKENAELLNIFECSNVDVSDRDLECYIPFYNQIPDRIAFFPQYYRFFTSIACDLEALGLNGNHAQTCCEFVENQGLINAELSDLQRAEVMRLLARRDIKVSGDDALRDRLHRFIEHSASFALPNRKAAYELTHIVFYLSEYGRRDPQISESAIQSLLFTGTLAHLEQNADLLAEVCIALRYAGQTPPKIWEDWIKTTSKNFTINHQDEGSGDHYHEYLVSNWALSQMGMTAFEGNYSALGSGFYSAQIPLGVLGGLSEILLTWDGPRHANWAVMKRKIVALLDETAVQHLLEVERASPVFDAFFEHFSRANPDAPKQNRPHNTFRMHSI